MASVCVIGGGPAGSTFASRMAQLGHDVHLIEHSVFPRPHLGESLSPGVLPLLATTGAHGAIAAAGFTRVRNVTVAWDGPPRIRADEREQGLLVDRGRFDDVLLHRARDLGVRILQPAGLIDRKYGDGVWTITVEMAGEVRQLRADFLVDARGRAASGSWRRERTGPSTLALYAYWQGNGLPDQPVIEAGNDAWYWGVPLPDGTCNILAFVDTKRFGASRDGALAARFLDLLGQSSLLAGFRDAEMIGSVKAIDATPYLASGCVTPSSIAVGEAALALDPISSSGVQKAIQSALAGAVVANTLLRAPSSAPAATAFYTASLSDASARHCRWAAGHYAAAAQHRQSEFWRQRAASPVGTLDPPQRSTNAGAFATRRVELSRDLVIAELPCIEGDFVVLKPALRHPGLAEPVAYLGNQALAPLMAEVQAGATPLEIAQGWSDRMPLKSALSIAAWLLNAGILVDRRQISGRG